MRTISLKCVIALVSLVVAGIAPGPAHATPGECQRAIIKGYPNYVKKTLRELQRCEDKIARGGPVLDCRTEFITSHRIEEAETDFRRHVNSACGGNNHTCNAGDIGRDADEPLPSIGWDVTCPDFEGSGCTNAISDCNDIVDCLFCTTNAAQSQALALYYHSLNRIPPPDRALGACQREIGKRAVDFFWRKLQELQTCERKVLSGDLLGPCPDATTRQRIDYIEALMHAKICSRCGGADGCGGAADRTPTEIGFTPNCPDVTIPGGAACGGAIDTFSDIATCVECVTEFKVDCLDAVSVPRLRQYPTECNTVP